jgi:hypothetical protein
MESWTFMHMQSAFAHVVAATDMKDLKTLDTAQRLGR